MYLGLTTGNWVTWQVSSLIGIVLGASIPTSWGLELAGVIALLALAIPSIATMPAAIGCIAASVVALLGAQ